jgi:hypothetical protein
MNRTPEPPVSSGLCAPAIHKTGWYFEVVAVKLVGDEVKARQFFGAAQHLPRVFRVYRSQPEGLSVGQQRMHQYKAVFGRWKRKQGAQKTHVERWLDENEEGWRAEKKGQKSIRNILLF